MPAPVLFLTHGPGPLWLLDPEYLSPEDKDVGNNSPHAQALKNLVSEQSLPRPKALLVVSAHHVEKEHRVMTSADPGLLYDYGHGYPEVSYEYKWPAAGSPSLATRVQEVLEQAGITCGTDDQRGLDHGVFVPLSLVYPKADIPVVQVSLKSNMSFQDHLKFGEALAPLRNEDVMIVGSGFTTHNTSHGPNRPTWYQPFMHWFNDVFTSESYSAGERKKKLEETKQDLGENFKGAHPTDDHFLPALVAAAAAGYKHGHIMYEGVMWISWVGSHLRFD